MRYGLFLSSILLEFRLKMYTICNLQPPMCDEQGNNLNRKRRQVDNGPKAEYRIDDPLFAQNATIELFGGFYVTDTTDNRDTRLFDGEPLEEVKSVIKCLVK